MAIEAVGEAMGRAMWVWTAIVASPPSDRWLGLSAGTMRARAIAESLVSWTRGELLDIETSQIAYRLDRLGRSPTDDDAVRVAEDLLADQTAFVAANGGWRGWMTHADYDRMAAQRASQR